MDKRGLMESVIALILAAVVAISLLSFTNTYLATDTPQVAVTTGSMLPVYNGYQDTSNSPVHPFRGDLLVVKGDTEYHVGDVIVFDDPRGVAKIPIVHRIIDVKIENGKTFYRTKGDNNVIADPFWVPKDNIHGKVILRVPHVGWLSLLMRTDPYRYILIALIGVIILVSAFRVEEEETEKDKNEIVEDTEVNDKSADMETPQQHDVLDTLKKSLKDFSIMKKTVASMLKNGYVLIILSLLLIFIVGNLATWGFSDNGVNVLTSEGNALSGRTINLNSPGVYSWESNNGSLVIGLYVTVTITSSGFFDWVRQIDFTTSSDQGLKKTVTWTVVYAWSGEKTIDWLILVAFPASLNVTTAFSNPVAINLVMTVHSAGLLSTPPTTKTLTFFVEE